MAANSSIYLCRYNNYANHEEKKLGTTISTADIGNTSKYGRVDFMSGIDFNPGDGVSTTLICNRNNEDAADYIFVLDDPLLLQPSSRWFILKSDRLRNGQYRLTLKRDLIADFYSDIKDSPIYVQKATLANDDPMIFNDEAMSFNQIKTSQTPLPDATNCGWIVGYVSNDIKYDDVKNKDIEITSDYDYTYANIKTAWFYRYVGGEWGGVSSRYIGFSGKVTMLDKRVQFLNASGDTYGNDKLQCGSLQFSPERWVKCAPLVSEYMMKFENLSPDDCIDGVTYGRLIELDGKVIRDEATGKTYKFRLNQYNVAQHYYKPMNVERAAEKEFLAQLATAKWGVYKTGTPDIYTLWSDQTYYPISPTLTETVATATFTLNIKWPTSYPHLSDAPYSMFCIPCPVDGATPNYITLPADEEEESYSIGKLTRKLALSTASSLATALGATSGYIYDLQYLPYCPIKELRNGVSYSKGFWARDTTARIDYVPVFWAYESQFELSIPTAISIGDNKVSHCCDKYRLMSPNFANYIDFDPAMNGGVSSFHIIATYKPYTPYINVHPTYGWMYGKDYDDNRGLSLGGDFSLPVMSDAWTNYQIQNKNYANIFDRQLKNMETNQNIARTEGAITGVLDSISDSFKGFTGGGTAGAIVGGTTSLLGAGADIGLSEWSYNEQRSFAIDNYNYSLQNIQALPDTLVKSSSVNINNTTFPIIEYYTCTDEERDAFRQKLEYDGMTVMRFGTLSEFINSSGRQYFQGRLVQCDDFNGDAHMFSALQSEIARGFHIIGG